LGGLPPRPGQRHHLHPLAEAGVSPAPPCSPARKPSPTLQKIKALNHGLLSAPLLSLLLKVSRGSGATPHSECSV
jgi:hypothetical protein